ncbi:MAG: hypothetical protein R3E66_23955 [bacterium]
MADASDEFGEFVTPARTLWIRAALVVLCLIAAAVVFWPREFSAASLFGPTSWTPSHDSQLQSVDLLVVHAQLLPAWGIASANREVPGGKEAEAKAAAALRAAIAADKNLTEIFDELRSLSAEPAENAERLIQLTKFWSAYLDGEGAPYLVQSNVVSTSSSTFFYLKSYEVRRDLALSIGSENVRAREVLRLDKTNIVEQYLGATAPGQEDATVVLDRLSEFAVSRVWPMLANDHLTPLGTKVVEELRANLAPEALRILTKHAPKRRLMQLALDGVESRRDCGSTFVIRAVGFAGLASKDLDTLDRLAKQAQGHPCPDITVEEAEILREASEDFVDDDQLPGAVRALVELLGTNVAIHEARHVVDDRLVDGLQQPMTCNDCPDSMSVVAIAELSAYLASIAWSPVPYTTFFQACDATEGQGGPHARAMALIMDRLETFCGEAPPKLAERAAGLELRILGRSDRVVLHK